MTGIHWDIQVLGTAESTQDLAREAAERGAPEGGVVQALQQTSGRGRHGNVWDSPMGNLYMSAVLRPACSPERAGQLAFVVALALSAAMDPYLDPERHRKTLKWPNDILIDGLKISGILLESNIKTKNKTATLDYVILGTGVNIFAPPEGAAGLDSLKTRPVYVNVFRDEYLAQLSACVKLWQEKGFAHIREAWLKQAHGLNSPMRARLADGREYKGTFAGLDPEGALLLESGKRTELIRAGEVYFS